MQSTRALPQPHPWALLSIAVCLLTLGAVASLAEDGKSRLRRPNHFPKLTVAKELAADRTLGTTVSWERSVDKAAEKARREGKLVFVIHASGDFENPEFT